MRWNEERLRVLVEEGWSDADVASLHACTAKAVAMARYRLGIPAHQRCVGCGVIAPVRPGTNRTLKRCAPCLDEAVLIYLASGITVALLSSALGVGATTLKLEAQRLYGLTRHDLTDDQRREVQHRLRSAHALTDR